MKRAKKYIVVVIIVISFILIPCFPFVVCWGINGINQILSNHKLEFILQIDQPLSISIGDYCSILLALISCYITALLGWITYKLSISISQHDLRAENTMKIIIKQNIQTEINNNINLIENIENKINQNYADISTKQYSWVVDSNNIHLLSDNVSELTLISNLYAFFENYKAKTVLENEKVEWLIHNEQESIFKFKEIDFI